MAPFGPRRAIIERCARNSTTGGGQNGHDVQVAVASPNCHEQRKHVALFVSQMPMRVR